MNDDTLLFDSAFLAKLEGLYLVSKKRFAGEQRAERRSSRIGSSLEFADYRNYSPGDDLRTIDWNIYGRLDRLFIKLFEEEQDLQIHFLIDASASMRWVPEGAARLSKFDQARRIAASLSYVGLANLDRVNVFFFSDTLGDDMGFVRGKSQFHAVLKFLKSIPSVASETCLLASVREFAQRVRRRGLVFLFSDLFDPAGCEEAFSLLRFHGFAVRVVQVLDPADLDPRLLGDLRLIDSETSQSIEVTADRALLGAHRATMETFLASVEKHCRRRDIGYARAMSDVPFEDSVLRVLRDGKLLK